jgi:hypothetical protein
MRRAVLLAAGLCASMVAGPQPVAAFTYCSLNKTSDGFAALRKEPGTGSAIVRRVRMDEFVQHVDTVKPRGAWHNVCVVTPAGGRVACGWMHRSLVSEFCG